MENKKERAFLDNYEKHLLENGVEPSYENTSRETRERDLAELLETLNKGEESGN